MINKRGYRTLTCQFDEGHPTVSAIAPLIGLAISLAVLVLMRLATVYWATAVRCVEADQFWYSASAGNWPLAATFLLILFLLFIWNVLTGVDDWNHSKGTRIVVLANAIGILAMLYTFVAIHRSATIAYNSRNGLQEAFEHQPYSLMFTLRTEDECTTMRRFSGRWRIVDRQPGLDGFDLPAEWIELNPWGYAFAQDASWSQPYAEYWRPPYQFRDSDDKRWRNGVLFGFPWEFELRGETLILTTPGDRSRFEWQRSQITLQREQRPDLPVFPNPHNAYR